MSDPIPCRGCGERRAIVKGLCNRCYKRARYIPHPRPVAIGCSVEGCERPHQARGWCSLHYGSFRRWGDPLATTAILSPPVLATLAAQ